MIALQKQAEIDRQWRPNHVHPPHFMSNPKWIATLEALQEKRALRYLEQEAGIPAAFFDSETNKPDPL